MQLPGSQHGQWSVTHLSSDHLLYGRTGGWRTAIEHPSGWRIVHFEALREASLICPAGDDVATLQVPKGSGIQIADMVDFAQAWIESEGLTRGLPGLSTPDHD